MAPSSRKIVNKVCSNRPPALKPETVEAVIN